MHAYRVETAAGDLGAVLEGRGDSANILPLPLSCWRLPRNSNFQSISLDQFRLNNTDQILQLNFALCI